MKLNESLSPQNVTQEESLSSLLKNSRATVAAAALGVLAAACGGKAVVDGTDVSGQGGSAGSENVGGAGGEGGNLGGSGGVGGEAGMGGTGGMECPDGVRGQGANGNIDTAVVSVDSSSTPSSITYISGKENAVLMAFDIYSNAQEPLTLKALTVQGYTDCDTEGSFSTNPNTLCHCPSEENFSVLKDITYSIAQYVDGALVSDLENVNSADAAIIFNNLAITLDPQTTTRIEVRGTISNTAPYGALDDRLKLGVTNPSSLVLEDADGLTLGTDLVYVTEGAQNGGTADEGVIMTITEQGELHCFQPSYQSVAGPKGSDYEGAGVTTCQANGSNDIHITGLEYTRTGAGSVEDIQHAAIHNYGRRTPVRSFDPMTQTVLFDNFDITVPKGSVTSFGFVVGIDDNAVTANQHGFTLTKIIHDAGSSTQDINPVTLSISGASASSVLIRRDGTLNDMSAGDDHDRVAQFEIENGGTDTQQLQTLELRLDGTCTNVSNFELFLVGESQPLATIPSLSTLDLATFDLREATGGVGLTMDQGESRVFYVEADTNCADGQMTVIYLEEPMDLRMRDVYGGSKVTNQYTAANGSVVQYYQ